MLQSNSTDILLHSHVFILAFFAALWSLKSFIVSMIGGWAALSKRFRAKSQPYGDIKTAGPLFYTVMMRFRVRYGNTIRIAASSDALYLSILFPFRLCHPPLTIPWDEIKMRRTQFLWLRFVILTLGERERIPMRISERMARNLGILDRLPKDVPGS
jgi:hypothetical protein